MDPFVSSFMLLSVTIFAPMCEEVIFRGFIYRILAKGFSFRWGLIVSTSLFILSHGTLVHIVPIGLLGGFLYYVRDRYGLGYSIILHSLYNISVLVFGILAGLPIIGPLVLVILFVLGMLGLMYKLVGFNWLI